MFKRKSLICIVVFSSIVFSGCSNLLISTPSYDTKQPQTVHKNDNIVKAAKKHKNELGNTNGNLNNFGLAAEKEGWIYYLHEENNKGAIYKKKVDGSSNTKLCDDYGFYINVIEDYIYYNNADDDNKMYRIKKDGTGREKVSDDSVQNAYIEGKYIYYIDDKERKLYRLDIDTKEKTKLSDDIIKNQGIVVDKDFIYYGNKGICKIKKDGSQKSMFLQDNSYIFSLIDVDDQWIYYLNDFGINRRKKDGTSSQQLYKGKVAWGNIKGDYLYFSDMNNLVVYKMSKDGKNKVKLSEDPGYKINIAGNSIYYDYSNRPMKLKWMNINS